MSEIDVTTGNTLNQDQMCLNPILKSKLINASFIGLSVLNGALYFLVAVEGGENIIHLFNVSESNGNKIIYPISVGASLVYTMFTYKTLEAVSLKPDTKIKLALSLLAPFSAVAFLTAGEAGALTLGFSKTSAYLFGGSLFLLRIINCVDASVKFPKRLIETQESWNDAYKDKRYIELARLAIVWLASIGYVLCTTDAIYNSMQIIGTWLGLNARIMHWIGISAGALGAMGTLPLNVYWTHRGLKQLTYGGQLQANGNNPDPTDMYTYIAFLLVLPVMLGILGGATSSTGQMFGQVGTSSNYIRIITSLIYAACAGTPGMATLLRTLRKLTGECLVNRDANTAEEVLPLVGSDASSERPQLSSTSFFSPPRSRPTQPATSPTTPFSLNN